MIIYAIFILISLGSYLVQKRLTDKFAKYSRVPLPVPMTGADVARMMLQQNGITDVAIQPVGGTLSDHFDPTRNTVNLSADVFQTNSVAAAAVAAHECGHVLQHRFGYTMLKLRTLLVPAVSLASKWVSWILLIGIVLIEVFPAILLFGVALFAITTLFSLITLPVEIDASRRAVKWLQTAGITSGTLTDQASDALRAAAYTYVIAALGSLATLIYYAQLVLGRR